MKKKAFTLILTLILILTFSVNSTNVYADEEDGPDFGFSQSLTDLDKGAKKENMNSLLDDGTATVTESQENKDSAGTSQKETIADNPYKDQTGIGIVANGGLKLLLSVFIVIPWLMNWILKQIVGGKSAFTIEKLLEGDYTLFDIEFWKDATGTNAETVNTIRNNIALWYYSSRNLAAVGMVVVLIYTGIRMAMMIAMSNEGNAKKMARYKKLFINWIVGLALVFVLHLMMIVIIKISDVICDAIINIAKASETTGLETDIMDNTWTNLWSKEKGYAQHQFYYFIVYCMLAYYEFKFFVVYFMRAIKIYFYVVISPLVCMTYAVDKIQDDRSQAFDNWVNEFVSEVMKRLLHLFIYVIFIYSAGEIMKTVPLILIISLAIMSNAEKLIGGILLRHQGRFGKNLEDVHMRDFDVVGKLRS